MSDVPPMLNEFDQKLKLSEELQNKNMFPYVATKSAPDHKPSKPLQKPAEPEPAKTESTQIMDMLRMMTTQFNTIQTDMKVHNDKIEKDISNIDTLVKTTNENVSKNSHDIKNMKTSIPELIRREVELQLNALRRNTPMNVSDNANNDNEDTLPAPDLFADEGEFPALTPTLLQLSNNERPSYSQAATPRPEVIVESNAATFDGSARDTRRLTRFENQEHEREYKFSRSKKQIGLNLTAGDVRNYYPYDISTWTDRRIFRDPAYKVFRLNAVRNYLSRGTGIMNHNIHIDSIYCTIDNQKVIAWITSSERMIMEIFRGAAIVRLENFSVFASIPQGAKQRKKELEKLIQSFRVHNKNLKYQIRNGTRNLKLMLKFQEPNDFQFF